MMGVKCLKIPCILSLIGGNVMKNNDEILIGACDVYMYEFTGTEIPEHATLKQKNMMSGIALLGLP